MQFQISSINKAKLWLATKLITFVSMTLVLFANDLSVIFTDAIQTETTSYILIFPIIIAYLIYRKRKMLNAVLPLNNTHYPKLQRYLLTAVGALLVLTAVVLYWYGSYTFTPIEYHMVALPIFASGLVLLLFNLQTLRQLAFPIAFLLFLVPPPSELLFTAGATLSNLSSAAASVLVNLVGIPSTLTSEYGNPTVVITRSNGAVLNFTVDIACSGIYSLIGFFVFAVLIAYIIRDKMWKRIAVVLVGLPIIFLFNIVRITTILTIGYHYGEILALQVFHLLGGWVLIFIATMLLLFISERIFKTKILSTNYKSSRINTSPHWVYSSACQNSQMRSPFNPKISKCEITKTICTICIVSLLVSIQAPVLVLAQTPAVVITSTPTGQQVSTEILPNIQGYTLEFSYRDTEFEKLAQQDMSVAYIYTPDNGSELPIWATIEIATARSALHRWETCLISYPLQQGSKPRVTQIELRDIQISENPPVISRYFTFLYTKTNLTQAVLYWYEASTFTINSTVQQKNVKLSLIAYPRNPTELAKIENKLVSLAEQVVNYWKPIILWSSLTIILSQNSDYIAVVASTSLVAIIILYELEIKKQRRTNRKIYGKLSIPNKQLVNNIQEVEKTKLPTLDKITAYYQTTQESHTEAEILHNLKELEITGIIRSYIANEQDEPIRVWKTQI